VWRLPVDIPFTVGGGIAREADVEALLKKGADKISVNSAALSEPDLIDRLAYHFGKQCIVVAIDARYEKEEWCVYSKGGRLRTERELYTWALEVGERGAGEILFTSMDHDGTNRGFACEAIARLIRQISNFLFPSYIFSIIYPLTVIPFCRK